MTERIKPKILNGPLWRDRSQAREDLFLDDKGVIPREWLNRPLALPYAIFVQKLNAMIRYTLSEEQGIHPVLTPENANSDFFIEVWDIATDNNAIIGWPTGHGIWAREIISCSPEQVAWLKRRWEIEYEFKEALVAELNRAQLDKWSITMRRQRALEDAGLDDASIAKKREEVLCEARADDKSIAIAKEKVRARVRLQFPETDDEPATS